MLVLTRRISEIVRIGEQIQVIILSIHGDQVRLGINAPTDITIHREEIYQRIKEQEAANST